MDNDAALADYVESCGHHMAAKIIRGEHTGEIELHPTARGTIRDLLPALWRPGRPILYVGREGN